MNSIEIKTQLLKQYLEQCLIEKSLEKHAEPIVNGAQLIHYALPSDHPQRFSKIGGLPLVPAGFAWPTNLDFPMQFMMQLKMSEIHHIELAQKFLPEKGLLYFFTDERQDISKAFNQYPEKEEMIAELTTTLKKGFRLEKGIPFFTYFCEVEDILLQQAPAPKELEAYPFSTYIHGLIHQSLVRKEVFLQIAETLYLPEKYISLLAKQKPKDFLLIQEIQKELCQADLRKLSMDMLFDDLGKNYLIEWSKDGVFGPVSLNPDIEGSIQISGLSARTKKADFSGLEYENWCSNIEFC